MADEFTLSPPKLADNGIELDPANALIEAVVPAARADPDFHRHGYLDQAARDEEAIELAQQRAGEGRLAQWAIIVEAEDGRPIVGLITLNVISSNDSVLEGGYWVAAPHRRRGIATRALQLVTSWVEAETSARRIELAIQTTNADSRHVAEKAGYAHAGGLHCPQPIGEDRIVELYRWERGVAPGRGEPGESA